MTVVRISRLSLLLLHLMYGQLASNSDHVQTHAVEFKQLVKKFKPFKSCYLVYKGGERMYHLAPRAPQFHQSFAHF